MQHQTEIEQYVAPGWRKINEKRNFKKSQITGRGWPSAGGKEHKENPPKKESKKNL